MARPEHALIVAAGKGARMNTPVPKQFLEVAGKPVLLHALDAFRRYSKEIRIVLVLNEADFPAWELLRKKHRVDGPLEVQKGGATRFQSVKNGLGSIRDGGLVAIHDGARPLVSEGIIRESFRLASIHGAAVATVPLKESIRRIAGAESEGMDRSQFRIIQTPQTFDVTLITAAYSAEEDPSLTDDASVAERAGHRIMLFDGSYENIKVTTPEDLVIAEALLRARQM